MQKNQLEIVDLSFDCVVENVPGLKLNMGVPKNIYPNQIICCQSIGSWFRWIDFDLILPCRDFNFEIAMAQHDDWQIQIPIRQNELVMVHFEKPQPGIAE